MSPNEWWMLAGALVLVIFVVCLAAAVRLQALPTPKEQEQLEQDGWCFEAHGTGGGRGMQFVQPHRHPPVRPAGHTIPAPRTAGRPYRIEHGD